MRMVEDWLAAFAKSVDAESLANPQAKGVGAFLRRYAADIATVIEIRRDHSERELIIIDLLTGAPQAPVYPVLTTERVGILFVGPDHLPFVVALRDDFPDTEHQHIVPEGHPAVICIDDRPWAEARLTWTPAELIERILMWFRRAARGELHDARQPLDPILLGSPLSFIVARSILGDDTGDLFAEHDPDLDNVLRVKRSAEARKITQGMEPVAVFGYRVAPERMKRLRYAPVDLAGLASMLTERGVDLLANIGARLTAALSAGKSGAWLLNSRAAVIVEMPILSPRTSEVEGTDTRAFVTAVAAGDIALALGIALKQEATGEGSDVGYVRAIASAEADHAGLAAIAVQGAEVHLEFERDLAARLAGRATPDVRKVVLAGAGAIGSHVADCLIREGRFNWTVVDHDRLMPHNLARHIALCPEIPRPKAAIVAGHLNATIAGGNVAHAVAAPLLAQTEQEPEIAEALAEADIFLDASASLVAARALSDYPAKARRISVFFNPSGEAAVLLAEPESRALTIRDLEAQYLGLVLRTPRLADHLGKLAETVAYTGACRAITNRIPQSRVSVLSGLAASGISSTADSTEGTISIWTLSPNGEVSLDVAPAEPVLRYEALGWTIAIDAGLARRIVALREVRLPAETGGVLFGLVDIPAKHVHLVDATSAPQGSIEEAGGFVRGMVGVDGLMDDVRRRSGGQVRYVGEWHSHPPRVSSRPSEIDGRQLDWLAALMGMDSMPALMVIAADEELAVIFASEHATLLRNREAA